MRERPRLLGEAEADHIGRRIGIVECGDGNGQDQRPDMIEIQRVNPQLKFNNAQRGYLLCEVTPERWLSEFKVLDRVTERNGTLSTRARWAVAAGDPRLVEA